MVNLSGRIAAGITVVLFVVGGFFIVSSVRDIQAGFPFEVIDVTETLDPDGCRWALEVTMRNDSTEVVEVERIRTILNRRGAATFLDLPPVAVGETVVATTSWNATTSSGCPSSVSDVNHTKLTVHLNNDRTVSKGF